MNSKPLNALWAFFSHCQLYIIRKLTNESIEKLLVQSVTAKELLKFFEHLFCLKCLQFVHANIFRIILNQIFLLESCFEKRVSPKVFEYISPNICFSNFSDKEKQPISNKT